MSNESRAIVDPITTRLMPSSHLFCGGATLPPAPIDVMPRRPFLRMRAIRDLTPRRHMRVSAPAKALCHSVTATQTKDAQRHLSRDAARRPMRTNQVMPHRYFYAAGQTDLANQRRHASGPFPRRAIFDLYHDNGMPDAPFLQRASHSLKPILDLRAALSPRRATNSLKPFQGMRVALSPQRVSRAMQPNSVLARCPYNRRPQCSPLARLNSATSSGSYTASAKTCTVQRSR